MSRGRVPRNVFGKASRPRKIAGQMNGTERSYADLLDIRRAAGEVVAYWYECMTLKLANDTRYTPDFLVLLADGTFEVVEVKGSFVRDDARVKLRVAADHYPMRFVMMQRLAKKQGGGWRREEIPSDGWEEAA